MRLINADCFEALKDLADNSIDAVVSDPPYGLGRCSPTEVAECMIAWARGETWTPKGSGFMGKAWDAWVPPPELWREVLRVLKPGGHGLIFAGSRTQDLMAMSLRLAGFEMRDVVQWLYGSGFPKSHDVSKALDDLAGAEREVIRIESRFNYPSGLVATEGEKTPVKRKITAPTTPQAKKWEGFGTALKPAYEPALLVMKPLNGTVAQNVLAYECGGLNIDGCRIETDDITAQGASKSGRWPANLIFDQQAFEQLDRQAGSVSRFFYCAKPSLSERSAGISIKIDEKRANIHPTVKPIDLMRYLARLITPPRGIVLDPFMGSGSTGCACALEGFDFIGIERELDYFEIAQSRIKHWGGEGIEATEYPPEVKPPESDTLPLFDWMAQ